MTGHATPSASKSSNGSSRTTKARKRSPTKRGGAKARAGKGGAAKARAGKGGAGKGGGATGTKGKQTAKAKGATAKPKSASGKSRSRKRNATTETAQRKAFKDYFDRTAVKAIGAQVAGAWPKFDQASFRRLASKNLNDLEMMDRVRQISAALRAELPTSMPRALAILTQSLPPLLPDTTAVTDGYLQWPLGQFIADYGVEHFEPSLKAMIELTQRFSSEFAVRPFVERYPEEIFERLLELTQHESPHVRRWCSEGTRTRLPWGAKLHQLVADPSPIFPILEALKDDPELYVRKSVANNLNDIAKDHPEKVIQRLRKWKKGASRERQWIIRHALRTQIKAGDPTALKLLGYGDAKGLKATIEASPKTVKIGSAVELRITLENQTKQTKAALVDYAVHYVTKTGTISRKVFKWKTLELAAGEIIELSKKHAFKVATIRALYPGVHRVEVQVNGGVLSEMSIELQQ